MDRLPSLSSPESPLPPSHYPNSPSIAFVNVANFVSTKLDWLPGSPDTNYRTWREQMLCVIKSQGMMNYIDETFFLPLTSQDEYDVWERNNALVRGWILGSLSDQIASIVLEHGSARGVWSNLEKKFGPPPRNLKTGVIPPYDRSPSDVAMPIKCVIASAPLYRAAANGNWDEANLIFTENSKAKTNWIDCTESSTPLHVAIAAGEKAIKFVTNLVNVLTVDQLEAVRDSTHATALHTAATVGNKEAAILLVGRNPNLWNQQNKFGRFPIHAAALYKQREVLEYLIECKNVPKGLVSPYADLPGQHLLTYLIQAEYFDIALRLAKDHKELLQVAPRDDDSDWPLTLLTIKKKTLDTKNSSCWERFISSWIVPLGRTPRLRSKSNRRDIESMTDDDTHESSGKFLQQDSQGTFTKCLEVLAPQIKRAREKMLLDKQAQQLLKSMCEVIGSQDFNLVAEVFYDAIFVAAEIDASEVIEAIIGVFPSAIYTVNRPSGQHIFHKAIEDRSANVFNLIYKMSDHKFFTTSWKDNYGNTPLHSAGKLAPLHKLNETSGAALQMQREMQWFKEVEKVIHPYSRVQKNSAGRTPMMVFTEEHRDLKDAGEKWMKETSNSFTLVAALIATVMFTGAITVPGGNESSTGFPMFSKEPAFIAFAVSDAASLFASATSLLLFLSILTSRYSEEDFMRSLPTKLIFGLASLFLSIMSMMVSFIVTLYIVFGQKRHWVLFPLLIFACMPVASFVLFQFPLLSDLLVSVVKLK